MRASIALSLLVTGALMAQTPRPRFGPHDFETRLTQNLGLNAEQQNKVHAIMAESRLSQQGTHQQMQTLHTSLTEAIKAGDEAKIDKITQDIGSLHQQQTASHAKSMAKIYSTLTADQKAKTGANLELLLGGPMGGRRPGPPKAQQ
jgi:Spy/CpxP family protein refolding chaperone